MPVQRLLGAIVALALIAPSPALAESAPDAGKAWGPRPVSRAFYGSQAPDVDPELQRHYVEAHDGIDLYVETWLPVKKGSRVPPKKIPTILIMTPYVSQGVEEYPAGNAAPGFIEYMNARGYAVSQHHVRGTGESGGCLEQTAPNQWDDGARVVDYLGRDAPWSNGKVGMYGISYDAETQISVAGFGEPELIKSLKAIVAVASVGGQYEWNFYDGVPYTGDALTGNAGYFAGVSMNPGQEPAPQHYPEKLSCQGEIMAASADTTGDMTPYWAAREYREGADDVKAATLYVHGLRDFNVMPQTAAGWFDRLPKSTPHKGMFGVWNHAFPYSHGAVEPEWARTDWLPMATAWFDRYLKGIDTGVERWPDVQVQDSLGRWRVEREFPTTGGPVGQLGLGPDGTLGATSPAGSSSYTEGTEATDDDIAGQRLTFTTPKLKAPLHLAGQPVLDLWLTTSQPDGHIAANIEVLDPDGNLMQHQGSGTQAVVATYGFRSLRHLEPIKKSHFNQEHSIDPPTDTPIRVPVRFLPTDLVAPKGSSLRVTIAGALTFFRESQPSGSGSTIEILHDCDHPSVLRFLMPRRQSKLLNVRETDDGKKKLKSTAFKPLLTTGKGIATKKVCGKRPQRVPAFIPPTPANVASSAVQAIAQSF